MACPAQRLPTGTKGVTPIKAACTPRPLVAAVHGSYLESQANRSTANIDRLERATFRWRKNFDAADFVADANVGVPRVRDFLHRAGASEPYSAQRYEGVIDVVCKR